MTDLKTLVAAVDSIIFDMDGTMVNTEPLHAKAAVMVLNEMGIELDLESCLAKYYGMTDIDVLKLTCPHLNDEQLEQTIEQKNLHLVKIFDQLRPEEKSSYVTPGLFEFFEYLKFHNKKIAVISASEDIVVDSTLNCFAIEPFVDLKMGRGQTLLTKPHPQPYLEGMRRLQSTPERTLIFEDSPTGLKSAIASGALVVRITGFAHSEEILHSLEIKNFLLR